MRFVRFVRFVFSKRRFRFPSEALRVLGSSQGPPSRFSILSLRGRIPEDRASELEGRSVGENSPRRPLRLGAAKPRRARISTSTADTAFEESSDRVRVRTGTPILGGFVPPSALVSAPTVGLSARRLSSLFSFRTSSGPIGAHDESFGRRERLRLLSSLCNLCGLCRLKPRALLPNDFTYRRRSQCSSLFLRRPSFLRPGPFVSDLLLRAFLRVLLHVSLRASPRKGRFPSATRCRHDAARRA